jgi:asparagine synthase (glutamine-hydrolysing)
MCGIFGSTTSESQIEADSALLDLIHRGPDQQMVLTTQFCAIAYTRLAIVNENLPIHASVGCNENLTCFLNGEVYNFKKLRDSLVDLGHSIPEKYTDSDILCHLYEEYGDFFPNYLDGMFSIVIHDKKTGEIKIFRDQMGIKPMYYKYRNEELRFASEIKLLLASDEGNNKKNSDSLVDFFAFGYIPGPQTISTEIFHIEPGGGIRYIKGELNAFRWYQTKVKNKSFETEEVKISKLEELLTDSISQQLNHGVNPAILLSGGLDSSLLVALANKAGFRNLPTYHLTYPHDVSDKIIDTTYARRVSQEFKTDLTEVTLTPETFFMELDNALDTFSQPFAGVLSTYFIAKTISNKHKICLTGDGADELFGSYKRIRLAAIESTKTGGTKRSLEENLSGWLKQVHSISFDDTGMIRNTKNFISRNLDSGIKRMGNDEDSFNQNAFDFALTHDQKFLLPDLVLHFSDHLGMAHSLEIRPPFLSQELIHFARNLDFSSLFSKEYETKYILKKLGEKFFSRDFVYRKKDGFALPLERWMRSQFGTSWIDEKLRNSVHTENTDSQSVLDFEKARKFVRDFQEAKHNDFYQVFKIGIFLRVFEKEYES